MADRLNHMRRRRNLIPDWLWPHLTGPPEACPSEETYFSKEHHSLLEDVDRVLPSRLSQTEERVRIVEAKLLGMLALTSVLSAAVTASLVGAFTLGPTEGKTETILASCAVLLIFYVAIQLLRSLWATVAGLIRRSYRQLSPVDLAPQAGEDSQSYRLRLLNLQINIMQWNEWVVNQKVSEMAVAHVALRNALAATFFIILLALLFACTRLA